MPIPTQEQLAKAYKEFETYCFGKVNIYLCWDKGGSFYYTTSHRDANPDWTYAYINEAGYMYKLRTF